MNPATLVIALVIVGFVVWNFTGFGTAYREGERGALRKQGLSEDQITEELNRKRPVKKRQLGLEFLVLVIGTGIAVALMHPLPIVLITLGWGRWLMAIGKPNDAAESRN